MAIQTFPLVSSVPGRSWPVKRPPSFVTARFQAVGGKRTFSPQQSIPRWGWEIPYEFLRSANYSDGTGTAYAELQTLVGFYNARMADGAVFAYFDDEDNLATDAPFGTGDGSTKDFQLYRALGGFTEPVYNPTAASLAVKVNGGLTGVTLGRAGVVSFAVAPAAAAVLTWSGGFSWLCRFDDDTMDLAAFMSGLSQTGQAVRFSSEINP